MKSLISEIIGSSLEVITYGEQTRDWIFKFDSGNQFRVASFWRITGNGQVLLCDMDHSQKFGMPEPIDAAVDAKKLLGGKVTTAIIEALGDVRITFGNKNELEIYISSSGYEAWTFEGSNRLLVAQGGGGIAEFPSTQEKGPEAS